MPSPSSSAEKARQGDPTVAAGFVVYLSPRDYHRVHAPVSGVVRRIRSMAGDYYPVNSIGMRHVPKLLCRNRRVAIEIDRDNGLGRVTVVMVVAMIVGRITTVGIDARDVPLGDHAFDPPLGLARGDEIGAFHLGSTAVVLGEKRAVGDWLIRGGPVRYGQAVLRAASATSSPSSGEPSGGGSTPLRVDDPRPRSSRRARMTDEHRVAPAPKGLDPSMIAQGASRSPSASAERAVAPDTEPPALVSAPDLAATPMSPTTPVPPPGTSIDDGGAAALALAAQRETRRRARMLRIPDDEVARPQSSPIIEGASSPLRADGEGAVLTPMRIITISEPPPARSPSSKPPRASVAAPAPPRPSARPAPEIVLSLPEKAQPVLQAIASEDLIPIHTDPSEPGVACFDPPPSGGRHRGPAHAGGSVAGGGRRLFAWLGRGARARG